LPAGQLLLAQLIRTVVPEADLCLESIGYSRDSAIYTIYRPASDLLEVGTRQVGDRVLQRSRVKVALNPPSGSYRL